MQVVRHRSRFLEGWPLLGVFAAAILIMTAAVVASQGSGEAGVRALIRATARSSLLLFCAAYAASAIARFWPSPVTRWLLRNRRSVGLGFAVSQAVHYAAVAAVSQLDPNQFFVEEGRSLTDAVTLGAVLMLAAIVVLSFDWTQAWVGRRVWYGVHWIVCLGFWLSFASSFGGRVLDEPFYVPFALLLVATMGLRVAAYWARRRTLGRPGSPSSA